MNKSNYIKIKTGFSALEMMLVLALVSAILYITLSFSNSLSRQSISQATANEAYNYSQAVIRYITTHQNLLRELLSNNDVSNNKLATVSTQVLMNEGFIKSKPYFKNKLNQYPCTIIWYENHQIQSLIYYRDDNNSKQLSRNQLMYGLNHMGSMMGIYENGSVVGAAKDWELNPDFTNAKFVKLGSADISKGTNPVKYACSGEEVANNSYVVNVSSMLASNNRLPNDDTIHQYPDTLHVADDATSNNLMNSDLDMDYTDRDGKRTQSNIVFQMNPNCQMVPSNPATMQNYDPNVDGIDKKNENSPNNLGCRDRQLAIQIASDPIKQNSQQKVMMVTGFERGGDSLLAEWKDINNKDLRPFVGEVKASSFQPTAKVTIGTICDPREVGAMAQQAISLDPNDVNNIYISQVICMKSPLCEANTKGFCYMPIQNITVQNEPHNKTYQCPKGTFIDDSSIVINHIDIVGQITCVANKGSIVYPEVNCVANAPERAPLIRSDLLNTVFNTQIPLYRTVTIPPTSWQQYCGNPVHGGCGEGRGQIPDTQDTISRIQCTNDPSKAAVIIQVPG